MKNSMKRLTPAALLLTLAAGYLALQPVHADTRRLVIEDGNNALSNEQAREQKEQWDATHRLRGKVNNRVEKEFDKADRAFDTRDSCEQSLNVNAYWEPNTLRCLDRRTGRPVAP